MQFYRCKCGESASWTTMGVPACRSCSQCGSDLAQSPDTHSEPAPHRWVVRYDESTGQPKHELCLGCLSKRPLQTEEPKT